MQPTFVIKNQSGKEISRVKFISDNEKFEIVGEKKIRAEDSARFDFLEIGEDVPAEIQYDDFSVEKFPFYESFPHLKEEIIAGQGSSPKLDYVTE